MIEIGTRVYATENMTYGAITDPALNDGVIMAGDEGVVIAVDDRAFPLVEWDRGFQGGVHVGSIAAVTS